MDRKETKERMGIILRTDFIRNFLFLMTRCVLFWCTKDGNMLLCCHRGCGSYLHTWLVPKEEPNHFDQSSDVCTANRRWKTVTSDSFLTYAGFFSPPSGQRGDAQASELWLFCSCVCCRCILPSSDSPGTPAHTSAGQTSLPVKEKMPQETTQHEILRSSSWAKLQK